jgi:hypothetical protein
VIEIPLVEDFAVAANFVGDETVVVEGEDTVICAKPGRQKVEIINANFKDLNAYSGGRVWVFLASRTMYLTIYSGYIGTTP